MRIHFLISLLFISVLSIAQTSNIKGNVTLSNQEPAIAAVVYIENLKYYTTTDHTGSFEMNDLPNGNYLLQIRTIEAADYKQTLAIQDTTLHLNIQLKENSAFNLSEIVVKGKSKDRELKSKGFAVGVVDLKSSEKLSSQTSELLDRTAGIKLRQSGGMGSDIQYNINGLSGNSVRIFIDGLPIRNYGSSFSLANIPTSMIERIEVYKGVVPSNLAEDALGGAVNIILKEKTKKSMVTSYSYGSFNTHKYDLSGSYRNSKTGLFLNGNAYYNYSDNNYKVWGEQIYVTNPVTSQMDFVKAKRFHDAYQSYGLNMDLGISHVKWADKLSLGILYSKMNKDIQHGATMAVVYGDRTTNQHTQMINLKYEKKNIIKGLSFKGFGSYSNGVRNVVDTLNYRYNWYGKIYTLPSGDSIHWSTTGEAGNATLAENKEKMFAYKANLSYQLVENHVFNVNYLYNRFTRDTDDPYLSEIERSLTDTRYLTKGVMGFSYDNNLFNENLQFSAFYKHYHQKVALIDPEKIDGVYTAKKYKRQINAHGYGATLSYSFLPEWMVTLSGEKAFRLPEEIELLGSTSAQVDASYDLKPEHSMNLNLGIIAGPFRMGNHRIGLDVNIFYRDIRDMITRTVSNSLTADTYAYENLGRVVSKGFDAELSYHYKNIFHLLANTSVFNARFKEQYDAFGTEYIYYGDRLRNAPYFTANLNSELHFKNVFQKKSSLNIIYNVGYVHEFFRNWESLGGSNKTTIPTQWVQDLGIAYTTPNKKITLGVDAKNIFNTQVFDNWALQKAGRAFYGKISYRIF